MPWKTKTIEDLALSLGLNSVEVREKQQLMEKIQTIRKKQGLSQSALAKEVGVSQSRIAQIESGVGTSKVTFDILLNILNILGYDYKIVPQKAA